MMTLDELSKLPTPTDVEANLRAGYQALDVIAPDQEAAEPIPANFMQLVKDGGIWFHPNKATPVDKEPLEKMSAQPTGDH